MRKLILISMLALATCAFAEGEIEGGGSNSANNSDEDAKYKSLAERIGHFEKKSNAFNVYFNYAAAFRAEKGGNCADGNDGSAFGGNFYNKDLRFEIKGNLTDKFYYRMRHRLNRSVNAEHDNFARATDFMMIGWRPNDRFALQMGKMGQIWGGYEFDENPMFIYQYSDFLDNVTIFQAGISASWSPVKTQEIAVGIFNSNNFDTKGQYPWIEKDLDNGRQKDTRWPLTYMFNWNGNFLKGIVSTRWAIGWQQQAEGKKSILIMLGQKLNLRKFDWYFDYMGTFDDIDRPGIVYRETATMNELARKSGKTAPAVVYQNTSMNSFVTKAQYHITNHWNVFLKGMYEITSAPDAKALKNYRRSYGYFAGLEYYPDLSQDLRFSLSYQGRKFCYTDAAKAEYGFKNYDNNRIELGFMYRIKCF